MRDTGDTDIHDRGILICAHCGWGYVQLGPHGGYVCPQCFHTEAPAGEAS